MEWAFALRRPPDTRDERRRDASEAAAIFGSEKPMPDDYPTAWNIFGLARAGLRTAFSRLSKIFEAGARRRPGLGEFDPVETMIHDTLFRGSPAELRPA